jgi:DNA invertase Pin-like site-specific DNA recombinase
MRQADSEGWGIVLLEDGIDTTTMAGTALAHLLVALDGRRSAHASQKIRDALAVRRAQGVKLGRPATLPPEIVNRVLSERRAGATWSAIASGLDADHVPTAQGGVRWYPATVRHVFLAHTKESAA